MKKYSYTATIRMWNDKNEVKEIKFDNSDLNELKKDIISIFNANNSMLIERNILKNLVFILRNLRCYRAVLCGYCEYNIKDDKLYMI